MKKFIRFVSVYLGVYILLGQLVSAYPVRVSSEQSGSANLGASLGAITVGGSGSDTIRFNLTGTLSNWQNYTIAVYDVSAGFSANSITVLHNAGDLAQQYYDIGSKTGAQLGLLVIRDGTVAGMENGTNPYAAMVSSLNTPGNHLIAQDNYLVEGGSVFSFESTALGLVMGASEPNGGNIANMMNLLVSGQNGSVLDPVSVINCPVVPEPGTLALIGLGLSTMGFFRSRKNKRQQAIQGS